MAFVSMVYRRFIYKRCEACFSRSTDKNTHSNESFVVYRRTVLFRPLFMKDRVVLRGRGLLESMAYNEV